MGKAPTPKQLEISTALAAKAQPLLERLWTLRCQRAEELNGQASQSNGSAAIDPRHVKLGDLPEKDKGEARALENALIELFVPEAKRLARHYARFNPRSSEEELLSLVTYGVEQVTKGGFDQHSLRNAIWLFDPRLSNDFGAHANIIMRQALNMHIASENRGQRGFENRVKRLPGDLYVEGDFSALDPGSLEDKTPPRRRRSVYQGDWRKQHHDQLAEAQESFVERRQRQEQEATLLEHLEEAARAIPGEKRKKVLKLIFECIRETGGLPTLDAIGEAMGFTRSRAGQVVDDIMYRLQRAWAERVEKYPDELGDYPAINSLRTMRMLTRSNGEENGMAR